MNQVTTNSQAVSWTARQLDTIKRTVAKDTGDDEFNLFIEYCKSKQLDPFSKQVIALVFNKNKPDKRQMTIIVTQEGLRVLAARCGDYRPEETEPIYEYDEKLKSPINPLGIVKCSLTLWKQDPRSDKWHPVNGVAYWDEFSAAKDEWAWDEASGKSKPTGKKTLEENWKRMGRLMIAKCARMQAYRAGWPAIFSGVYAGEEMDRSRVIDLTASEIVEHEREERRAKAVGMSQDEYPWVDHNGTLSFVPAGTFVDHVLKSASRAEISEASFNTMLVRNSEGMKRFWARHKDDALQLKKELEQIGDNLHKKPAKVAI